MSINQGQLDRTLLEKIIVKMNALKEENNSLKSQQQHYLPIAIIGMSCRFPGNANDCAAYWQLMKSGRDCIGSVPSSRNQYYAYAKQHEWQGGFLDDIESFDAEFFNISPREAAELDPQQRILLQLSYHALEEAGQNISKLKGSSVGVFVGLSSDDYQRHTVFSANPQSINAYNTLGTARSIAAGRIAYYFGFQGPVVQLDTACSSSLYSVHAACQSIALHECTMALAGGINLMLSPETFESREHLQALSKSYRCKSFAEGADGYVRSEGGGMVLLKSLDAARRDGDSIKAVIYASVCNHDGDSNGLTAPNGEAQRNLLKKALKQSNLDATAIQFVETHGTGTKLGDPIEANALVEVFTENRSKENPLLLGAIKSQIGHLEAAAGIASLIKTVLCLHNEEIPANLHCEKLNSLVKWDEVALNVLQENTPWFKHDQTRYAGVSSFGLSGTNVHVIVGDEMPSNATPNIESKPITLPLNHYLIPISTKSKSALNEYVKSHIKYAKSNMGNLYQLAYRAGCRRDHYKHRAILLIDSHAPISQKVIVDKDKNNIAKKPKYVLYLPKKYSFSKKIMEQFRNFSESFEENLNHCIQYARAECNIELLDNATVINANSQHVKLFDDCRSFSFEYCIFKLLALHGITPSALLVQGVGNVTAACVNDVITLEEAFKLINTHATPLDQKIDGCKIDRFDVKKKSDKRIAVLNVDQDDTYLREYKWLYDANLCNETSAALFNMHAQYRLLIVSDSDELKIQNKDIQNLKREYYKFDLESLNAWEKMLAHLYVNGVNIKWHNLYRRSLTSNFDIPLYPFVKKKYWTDSRPMYAYRENNVVHFSDNYAPEHVVEIDEHQPALGYRTCWTDSSLKFNRLGTSQIGFVIIVSESNKQPMWLTNLQERGYDCVVLEGTDVAQKLALIAESKHDEEKKYRVVDCRVLEDRSSEDFSLSYHQYLESILQLVDITEILNRYTKFELCHIGLSEDVSPLQGLLHGFVTSLSLESKKITLNLQVDVELSQAAEIQIADILVSESRELNYHVSNAGCRVFRLRPEKNAINSSKLSPQHSYWIAGGLGGLGLLFARQLVLLGVRKLILSARNIHLNAKQKHAIEALRNQGCEVKVQSTDLCDEKSVEKIFADIESKGDRLAGIVNAAGASEFKPAMQLTVEDLKSVCNVKVIGTWNLHRFSQKLNLDFFVCCSSIASIWGSSHLSHYAAANRFQDALCALRNNLGLPATCFNWGPWKEAGMASGDNITTAENWGLNPLSTKAGLHYFQNNFCSSIGQLVVVDVDWQKFSDLFSVNGSVPNWISELIDNTEPATSTKTNKIELKNQEGKDTNFVRQLQSSSKKVRHHHLHKYLREQISHILSIENAASISEDDPLHELGIDSLMAVELKNKISRDLDIPLMASLIFDYPSIGQMSDYLDSMLCVEEECRNRIDEVIVENDEKRILSELREYEDAESNDLDMLSQIENLTGSELDKLLEL